MADFKYPRTSHLPFSGQIYTDDHVIKHLRDLEGRQVIISVKLDGQNIGITRERIISRSSDASHPSFDAARQLHRRIGPEIPRGWKVCLESMTARQDLAYEKLDSPWYGLSVWDEANVCCGFAETEYMMNHLGIPMAPVLHKGLFSLELLRALAERWDVRRHEGFVVRTADPIPYDKFLTQVCKWVRPGHRSVGLSKDWQPNQIIG